MLFNNCHMPYLKLELWSGNNITSRNRKRNRNLCFSQSKAFWQLAAMPTAIKTQDSDTKLAVNKRVLSAFLPPYPKELMASTDRANLCEFCLRNPWTFVPTVSCIVTHSLSLSLSPSLCLSESLFLSHNMA